MSNPRKGGFTKRNDGGGPKRNNAGNSNNCNNDRAGGDKRTYPDPVLGGALSLVEQIDSNFFFFFFFFSLSFFLAWLMLDV
jgi:hypothetical protein